MNDQSTAVAAPRVPRPPLVAGDSPRAIVPVDFDGAYRIANVVHTAGMAPKSLNTLEKVMVAILHGLEVGLTPMNALQSIAVINGRPTIWGDGAVGLIRASGLLDYMKEYYVDEDKPTMKAVCEVKRKGEREPVVTDFSMADAKKAGLLTKEGPWQTYPKRMLKMRARWALRDTFSDVLKGLRLREEEEDLERSQQPDAQQEPAEDALADVPAPPTEAATTTSLDAGDTIAIADVERAKTTLAAQDDFPGDKPINDDPITSGLQTAPAEDIPWMLDRKLSDNDRDLLLAIKEAFEQCSNVDEIGAEWESIALPAKDAVSPYVWSKAEALMDQHIERVNG